MNAIRFTAAVAAALALGGCAGMFRSHEPAVGVYTLHARPAPAAATALDATLVVARPAARSGLDGDRIVVTLPDRRLDAYAGARWSAPLPRLVEGLLVDGLRGAGAFRAVVDERSAFGGRYLLQVEIAEFAADYAAAGSLPVARVALRGSLGVSGERRLIASVAGSGAVAATADRQREVAAAFEGAYAEAAAQLIAAVDAAAAADAARH
jgi:cholesterol transport system auxiliary component